MDVLLYTTLYVKAQAQEAVVSKSAVWVKWLIVNLRQKYYAEISLWICFRTVGSA